MGQSLAPALQGKPLEPSRPIAFESSRRMQGMLFPDGMKLLLNLRTGGLELYDLKRDPKELANLIDEPSARGHDREATLRRFFAAHQREGYEPPWRKF